jgi:16S rRNA (guanine(966)-N(2))-methyltransferase RsmD
MRIIAGTHKGRRLRIPKNLPVRPTTDRAKEALFSILNHKLSFESARVLDLYSGTGSIGFEFCSRGCPNVIAVDADHKCSGFIAKTAEEFGLSVQSIRSTVQSYLSKCVTDFDIIFADPPYKGGHEEFQMIKDSVQTRKLLRSGGWLIFEHAEQLDFSSDEAFIEARKYGSSVLSFFQFTA